MLRRSLTLGLTTALAAALSACGSPTTETGAGSCGQSAAVCLMAFDCCAGLECLSGRCAVPSDVSAGPDGGSAGTTSSSGGSSTSGASTGSSSSGSGSGGTSTGATSATGGSTGQSSGGTTGGSSTGAFSPAPHQSFPAMPDNGVLPLASPRLVTLSFSGYEATYPVGQFGDWIVTSQWLKTVGAPFGIASGTHLDYKIPQSAPPQTSYTDAQIQSYIQTTVTGSGGAVPAPSGTSPSSIYMLFLPTSVSIVDPTVGSSCQQFGGYHGNFTDSSGNVWVYAIIATCAAAEFPGVNAQQQIELYASHEFIEAATDPVVNFQTNASGYNFTGLTQPDSWLFDLNEVADLCLGAPFVTDPTTGYMTQEVWNVVSAADATQPPCSPWPSGTPYFNVSPVAHGFSDGLAYYTAGSVPSSVTFDITGWSNVPVAQDWYLVPMQTVGSFSPTSLTLSAPGQAGGQFVTMNNGKTATLTVALPSGLASHSYVAIELMSTDSTTGLPFNEWPVAIYVE